MSICSFKSACYDFTMTMKSGVPFFIVFFKILFQMFLITLSLVMQLVVCRPIIKATDHTEIIAKVVPVLTLVTFTIMQDVRLMKIAAERCYFSKESRGEIRDPRRDFSKDCANRATNWKVCSTVLNRLAQQAFFGSKIKTAILLSVNMNVLLRNRTSEVSTSGISRDRRNNKGDHADRQRKGQRKGSLRHSEKEIISEVFCRGKGFPCRSLR